MALTLTAVLLVFLVSGLWPLVFRKERSHQWDAQTEYFLGSTSLSGIVAGLSSATTSNSAFMFVVMIPLIAGSGGASAYWAWLLIGWVGGIASAWFLTYRRIKALTDEEQPRSFIELLSNGLSGRVIAFRRVACVLIILFLGVYASGQLIATHDTLSTIMGGSAWFFVLVSAAIVLLYSSAGGLRSTVYSDVAQAAVVLIGGFLLLQGLVSINYPENPIQSSVSLVGQTLQNELFSQPLVSTIIFIAGWFFGGFFEMAQPHVMIRVMAIRNSTPNQSSREIVIGASTYLMWFVLLSALVTMIGCLAAHAASQNLISGLSEAVGDQYFGLLVIGTLEPWQAGICIAGLLAASISTADAQILSAGAAVSQDWSSKPKKNSTLQSLRLTTLLVGLVAFGGYYLLSTLGLGVYKIITLSWSLIAASFAPAVLYRIVRRKLNATAALIGAACGIVAAIAWSGSAFSSRFYEAFPAVVVSLLASAIVNKMIKT